MIDGDDHSSPDPRFLGLYEGVVAANDDPLRVGRVRVVIPGVIDEPSAWAPPLGASGGGAAGRGSFVVPKVGADVAVFFKQGDPDQPRYLAGPWGAPAGAPETPEGVRGEADPAKVHQVGAIQTDRWELVLDDRQGSSTVRIRDLLHPETVVELDGESHGVRVSGAAAVLIESVGVVNVRGLQIILNGRVVRDSGEPI